MPRKKKDGRFINYYVDKTIYDRLEQYAQDKSQTMTAALERILDEYLTRYEVENARLQRYCPACHMLVKGSRCPACGRTWLEVPGPEDYCFLTEKDAIWSGVLEDCLRQQAIPVIRQNTMGAGLTSKTGMMMERTKFYVPYSRYAEAAQLEQELFSAASGEEATDGE